MKPSWHGEVGVTLTGRDGSYCGRVGLAFPCDSLEDGWAKAVAWLRQHGRTLEFGFLIHTWDMRVRYF